MAIVSKKNMPTQVRDDIQSILSYNGIFSRRLARLEQISNQMQQLEWKMLKGSAANASIRTDAPPKK